jgi:ribosomal protein S6
MSETQMPAAEAAVSSEKETTSYELAFHVLPTVAEGEVTTVVDKIKSQITKLGGEIFDEEAAQRFDLAYEIAKYLEGRNRRFSSAYFGWVRFRLTADQLEALNEALEGNKDLLRHLLVKLTRVEEANPFRFHESIADRKVRNIDVDELAEETDGEVVEGEEVVDEAAAEEVSAEEEKAV